MCFHMFFVNCDALAQASEFRIERRQVVYLCWMQYSKLEWSSKNLNSIACPFDERAFSPLDFTADWLSDLAVVIYTFVVVNFDGLAQASDFRIEWRQVVFLCWMQDSKREGLRHQTLANWMFTHKPTGLSRIKQKFNSPCLWWVSIQPTWLHCWLAFAPGCGDIHVCC